MKYDAGLQSVHSQGEKAEKASEQIITMKCHKCYDKVLCRSETGEKERKEIS